MIRSESRLARLRSDNVSQLLEARVRELVAVGAGALVGVVGLADGGYFPTTWGWILLALAWAACLGLLLRDRLALGPLDVATVAALALFVLWVAASLGWSGDRSQTILEIQRDVVYLVGVLAAVVVVSRRSVGHLLVGLLAGIVAVDAEALRTRLFPSAGSERDSIVLDQLSQPVGYANGLGILTVLGTCLAVGLVARAQRVWVRAAAAAVLPVLLTTLYFTYSRGPWLSLFAAVIAMVALDPRRLQLVTTAAAVAPWSALAVWWSSRAEALTSFTGSAGEIRMEGRQLAGVLLLLAVASGATAALLARVEWKAEPSRAVRRATAAALAALALTALASAFVRYGDPVDVASRAYDSFRTAPSTAPAEERFRGGLNERLFTFDGTYRVQLWRAAWEDYEAHPWLGSGAGSFEREWLKQRTINLKVRDAHSLYMEVLAELGWPGLLLLATALVAPLVAAARARRNPLVLPAFGAYVAYVLHAGIDWDWELPAVTLAALLCGAALVVWARDDSRPEPRGLGLAGRATIAAAVIAVAAFGVVGLLGNRALASATRAVDGANWQAGARDARAAIRWMPWSGQAWQQLGDAQLGLGDRRAARASLLKAAGKGPEDWSIWFDLGTASRGDERVAAYRRAAALNPRDPNVELLRARGR